jgi:hypothetical protein
VRELYCDSGPNIIATNARLQAPCGFLLYAESVEVAGKTSGPSGGVF